MGVGWGWFLLHRRGAKVLPHCHGARGHLHRFGPDVRLQFLHADIGPGFLCVGEGPGFVHTASGPGSLDTDLGPELIEVCVCACVWSRGSFKQAQRPWIPSYNQGPHRACSPVTTHGPLVSLCTAGTMCVGFSN